jgi:hypothetical protein
LAIVVDRDETGVYGVLECHWSGCDRHVAVRPPADLAVGPELVGSLIDVVAQWAEDDGWLVEGHGWCPAHRARGARTARAGRRPVLA